MLSIQILHYCNTPLRLSSTLDDRWVLILDGTAAASAGFNRLNNAHGLGIAVGNLAENDMLAIEPRGDNSGDEELGTVSEKLVRIFYLESVELRAGGGDVRVGSGVGHRQEERLVVLKLEVLVGELLAIDGLATGAL